jgi:phage terminase large subunit-like protein
MIALDPRLTAADVRAAALAMPEREADQLLYDWRLWARPEQLMPEGDWRVWLVCAGRGFGKTRCGVEAVREIVTANSDARVAIVAPTSADARDVIIEGESGLLAVFPPGERPEYFPSKRRVQFRNGAMATLYSAQEPERLRGPQHHCAYLDELATYEDPEAIWSNLQFGLRLGSDPRIIATTTPRPSRFLRALIADPGTAITRGSTFANRANLPPATLSELERIYGGTRIGRQELEGELLEEAEGALWTRRQIDALRVTAAPDLVRIVVAIDPSVTPTGDECGIVAAGLGADGHGYVLRDRSGRLSPDDWISRAIATFDEVEGDRLIGESNNGGDLIESLLRTKRSNISYEKVHASRGKITRAEPVAALFEQQKVHMAGAFPQLEDELCTYVQGMSLSPNRLDAMVWALSYLMLKPAKIGRVLGI